VYRSAVDHVVGPASLRVLRQALPARQLEVRECPDSYHVATLDNDAQAIFAGSLEFIRTHGQRGTSGEERQRGEAW
jgi:carboxylesterase